MESTKEIMTFYGRCRCCLDYGYMKSMWKEHIWDDEREIYGEMLMETFNIAWDSNSTDEHICELCVTRLRDAYHFKKDVLASELMLQDDLEEDDLDADDLNCKEEILSEDEEYILPELIKTDEKEDCKDFEEVKSEAEYGEIEFLEEDAEIVEQSVSTIDRETDSDGAPKQKLPRKRRKHERTGYRQYSQADLKRCVELLQHSEGLSQSQAARMFNIPTKTVNAKMRSLTKANVSSLTQEKQEKREKIELQNKFVEEIQTILQITNSIPFKVKSTYLYCAYCYLSGSRFEDPDELRIHTLEEHKDDRTAAIEGMLRPVHLNEILRIDVTNLSCMVCETRITGWNEMFQHLFDIHNLEFDQAYTRLIPYKLSHNYLCALCNEPHSHFHNLDSHMNAHYNNQVCPECGDTFISVSRIKKHMAIHSTGTFPCQQCSKVFTLKKYRDKHTAMVHEQAKVYKCFYCPEGSSTEYGKHLHVRECHKDKLKFINCEICGKVFDWRPYYLAHLRKTHYKEKRYQCSFCMKWFGDMHNYKLHVQRHTGEGKFVCDVCNKNFVRQNELRRHKEGHEKTGNVKAKKGKK